MSIHCQGAKRGQQTPTSPRGLHLGLAAFSVVLLGCGESIIEVEAPVDPCAVTQPISVGQEEGGELVSADCNQYDGLLTDRWSLTLSEDMGVRIDMTSPAFDGGLQLLDNFGTPIAWGYDGMTNARIGMVLPAATYTILVQSFPPGATGSYVISVADAPECESLGDLVLGTGVAGTLTDDDCWVDSNPFELWSLEIASPQKLRIDLKSSDFDEVLLLRDQDGFVYWGADWQGPAGNARVEAELTPGDWTVMVGRGYMGGSGAYTLTADVAPACTPGTDIIFGETVFGDISSADCLFDGWAPADSFALVVTEDVPFALQAKSTDMDPWMLVRDQRGFDVAWGQGDYDTGVSSIRASLDPGEYSLIVLSNSWPPVGSYELTASEIECADPEPIAFGTSASGTLGIDDCLRPGGAFQDRWQLVLANDTTVRIDLTAGFDSYLILKDSLGNEIEANDDGGNGFDARIEQSLTAGTYEIVASSFSEGQTGSYTLAVDAPPPPTAASDARGSDTEEKVKVEPVREHARDILTRLRRRYEESLRTSAPGAQTFEKYRPGR